MLWKIEAAGSNQEDVVLFSCQIINSGQTVGEDGRAGLLGMLYAKLRLVVYFKNSGKNKKPLQVQFNGSCRFKLSMALVHELPPLLSVESFF